MIFSGQEGRYRIFDLQKELEDRDATPEDRAEVELIKTVALCDIAMSLAQLVRRNEPGKVW